VPGAVDRGYRSTSRAVRSHPLGKAARPTLREMSAHICRRTTLADHEGYMLCSLAGDLRVAQTVDGVKGCHMTLAKSCL